MEYDLYIKITDKYIIFLFHSKGDVKGLYYTKYKIGTKLIDRGNLHISYLEDRSDEYTLIGEVEDIF